VERSGGVNSHFSLQHDTGVFGYGPVFANPQIDILQRRSVRVIASAPRGHTDGSVDTPSVSQGLVPTDLGVTGIGSNDFACCVQMTIRSGHPARPSQGQMGLRDGVLDVYLQAVSFVDVVSSIEEPAVEIVDIEQVYIQSPAVKSYAQIDLGFEYPELHIRHADIPPHVGINAVVAYVGTRLDIRSSAVQSSP